MSSADKSRLLHAALLAARLLLGAVFLYAAYTKLWTIEWGDAGFSMERRPWAVFAMSVNSYRLLPEWAVVLVARTLPWFELVLGVLLIAGLQLRWVAAAASALLVFFLAVMLRSYSKGLGIDCGCFGVGEAMSVKTLARDGMLAAMSVVLTVAAFVQARKARANSETAVLG